MKYQIDQSGKVEDTKTHTVIACANHKQYSLIIKATAKRNIKKIFDSAEKPKVFTIQVFSALVYLLIEKSNINPQMLIIDREYEGKESLIKSYLIQFINKRKKIKLAADDIHFSEIGKKSTAHKCAITAFRKRKADINVKENEVLKLTEILQKK